MWIPTEKSSYDTSKTPLQLYAEKKAFGRMSDCQLTELQLVQNVF